MEGPASPAPALLHDRGGCEAVSLPPARLNLASESAEFLFWPLNIKMISFLFADDGLALAGASASTAGDNAVVALNESFDFKNLLLTICEFSLRFRRFSPSCWGNVSLTIIF
ncbi:hypothetical protein EI613_25420 [Azospirillum sp. 412522]|nr:hypothetical protein [Azospirillum sp. 412522]MBY6265233.1 hypothetical protein [Azospirillum sp. 412522]